MGMENVEKAVMDTVLAANTIREDLSNTMTLLDGPPRPVTQNMPQVPATSTLHQWNEQNIVTAGRNNVASGGATYAQSSAPPTNVKSTVRRNNVTCRTGRMAQVSDDLMAAFNGGNTLKLADGEMERLINDALDLDTALCTIEILNQIEWMHVSGDSTNATMEGGETDGLIKWITASGVVVNTGGSTGSAVAITETFVKDGARSIALNFPTWQPDTLLLPPSVNPDVQLWVQNGAGRPLVQITSGDNSGLVGGNEVSRYNTGYSVLDIKYCPYLDVAYNTSLSKSMALMYNKALVKHAALIKLNAEPLARTDTSVKRMVTCNYGQEHRVPLHSAILPYIKSAIT